MSNHWIISDGKIVQAPKTARQRFLGALAMFGAVMAIAIGALSLASPAKAAPELDEKGKGTAGVSVCKIFDALGVNTGSLLKIADIVVENGGGSFTYGDAGSFIMTAVRTNCPQYVGDINNWARAHGNGASLGDAKIAKKTV